MSGTVGAVLTQDEGITPFTGGPRGTWTPIMYSKCMLVSVWGRRVWTLSLVPFPVVSVSDCARFRTARLGWGPVQARGKGSFSPQDPPCVQMTEAPPLNVHLTHSPSSQSQSRLRIAPVSWGSGRERRMSLAEALADV